MLTGSAVLKEKEDAERRGNRQGYGAGAAAERAACAKLVRAAGCICSKLSGSKARYRPFGHYQVALEEHDPRCPKALAKAIEARGKLPAEAGAGAEPALPDPEGALRLFKSAGEEVDRES